MNGCCVQAGAAVACAARGRPWLSAVCPGLRGPAGLRRVRHQRVADIFQRAWWRRRPFGHAGGRFFPPWRPGSRSRKRPACTAFGTVRPAGARRPGWLAGVRFPPGHGRPLPACPDCCREICPNRLGRGRLPAAHVSAGWFSPAAAADLPARVPAHPAASRGGWPGSHGRWPALRGHRPGLHAGRRRGPAHPAASRAGRRRVPVDSAGWCAGLPAQQRIQAPASWAVSLARSCLPGCAR